MDAPDGPPIPKEQGDEQRKAQQQEKVVPPMVGGASGSHPTDGPITTVIAALSIRRLCDCTSRRLAHPFDTTIA